MCGLFGYVGRNFDPELMQDIALDTEAARGGHAYGFAWLANSRTRMFKHAGRLPKKALEVCEGATALIGHVRFATHGRPAFNINNHPHPADRGWIVHNGTIGNYEWLTREFGLMPNSACDSEVLGQLIEVVEGKSRAKRIARAVKLCSSTPFAMLGLWGEELIGSRSNYPLHYVRVDDGIYIASLASSLPSGAVSIPQKEIVSFRRLLAGEVAA